MCGTRIGDLISNKDYNETNDKSNDQLQYTWNNETNKAIERNFNSFQ